MPGQAGGGGSRNSAIVGLAVSTSSISLGALPVFLLGALAVLVREELDFSEAQLGLAASAYYLSSAVSSVPGGRLCEAVGGRRAVAAAAAVGGASMLAIAALARSYTLMLVLMITAGIANGVSLPASNLVMSQRIPARRQGAAFGVKQSSGPISTLLAGASVPVIGLTVGWRWAFLLAALLTLPLVVWGHRSRYPSPGRTRSGERRVAVGPLVVMAAAAATAVVGGASVAAFYVESAVAAGIRPGVAGTVLAVGSVAGIALRILWGSLGDLSPRLHVPLLTALLAVGAVSFVLMGRVSTPVALTLVTMLTFGTGWGWPAPFNFAIVSRTPSAPALATGIAGTGLYAGGIVGPLMFGAVVEASGYPTAWLCVAVSGACSSVLFYIGGTWLDRTSRSDLGETSARERRRDKQPEL